MTEPDLVDDVVTNVLPKYQLHVGRRTRFVAAEYESDIERIVAASKTDSRTQRDRLIDELKGCQFVLATEASNKKRYFVKPESVYQATRRLKGLFRGISGIFLVDDSLDCLRGDAVRALLEACGAAECLEPSPVRTTFNWEQRAEMRRSAGAEDITGGEKVEDVTLRGLEEVLTAISHLPFDEARERAHTLWDSLRDVANRRGHTAFLGTYRWFYFRGRSCTFDAHFVRELNQFRWVPSDDKSLEPPENIIFERISPSWTADPYLLSKIRFKPPLVDTLAREAGIEPGVLDLLKKHGVTSVAELTARLSLPREPHRLEEEGGPTTADEAIRKLLGETPSPTPPVPEPAEATAVSRGGGRGDGSGKGGNARGESDRVNRGEGSASGARERKFGTVGGHPFISYVGAQPDDEEPDPDGLDQSSRITLEESAIALILQSEPQWQRTTPYNPGFDLFEAGPNGQPTRWCEVKAMTGTLYNRPVGLSRRQFDCAQERGAAYWLYVVEQAGTDIARIVRIQDPAGKARTFTFDQGWLDIAKLDSEKGHGED